MLRQDSTCEHKLDPISDCTGTSTGWTQANGYQDNIPPDNSPWDNIPPDNIPPDNIPLDNIPPSTEHPR